jgi:hypothetical protein
MATTASVWEEIRTAALAQRREGETPEQAIDRYLNSAEGQAAYQRYRAAPPPAPTAPEPPLPDVRRGCETAALGWIEQAAGHIQAREPGLSDEQAFVRAVEVDPQLYADYLVAKRCDAALNRLPPSRRVAPPVALPTRPAPAARRPVLSPAAPTPPARVCGACARVCEALGQPLRATPGCPACG